MITAILNSYKRPHTLKEQHEAIMSQTVGDPKVMLWSNSPDDYLDKFPEDVVKSCTSAFCNENLGVWAAILMDLINIFCYTSRKLQKFRACGALKCHAALVT